MIDALRRFIEDKISSATLERSPFPHLVIERFFPDEIYEKIINYNPFNRNVGEEWASAAESSNVSSRTPYYARKQINFHVNAKFDAEPDAQEFWNNLKNCFLIDEWFETIIHRKYDEYFKIRFGDCTYLPKFYSHFRKELFLQRHDPGYYIGPHTDIPTRVFTCIFSFAPRSGFEEYGTELLAHKDPLARCWGNDHYDPQDFTIKRIAPYKPNNFLLFFKTRHSFHSVRAITEEVPNQRYGMQFQFYEPPGGLFRDMSVPDLMVVKRRPVMEKRTISLVANVDTYLKGRVEMAWSLPETEKVVIRTGDVVTSVRQEPHGDHSKLFGTQLNGRSMASPDWFVYSPHWNRL